MRSLSGSNGSDGQDPTPAEFQERERARSRSNGDVAKVGLVHLGSSTTINRTRLSQLDADVEQELNHQMLREQIAEKFNRQTNTVMLEGSVVLTKYEGRVLRGWPFSSKRRYLVLFHTPGCQYSRCTTLALYSNKQAFTEGSTPLMNIKIMIGEAIYRVSFCNRGQGICVERSQYLDAAEVIEEEDEKEDDGEDEDGSQEGVALSGDYENILSFEVDQPGEPSVTMWAFKLQVLFRLKANCRAKKGEGRGLSPQSSNGSVNSTDESSPFSNETLGNGETAAGMEMAQISPQLQRQQSATTSRQTKRVSSVWSPFVRNLGSSGKGGSRSGTVGGDDDEPVRDSVIMNRQANAINLMRYFLVQSHWLRFCIGRRALTAARKGDMADLTKSIDNYPRYMFLNNARPLNLLNAATRNGSVPIVTEILKRFPDIRFCRIISDRVCSTTSCSTRQKSL
mmetsp:Transcript_106437/g.308460  ORF Transcript_106437/g.308460 Transcript_106437/m.308460 type:complete len:452 (-) Transcript_106437:2263-3618(-)